MAFASLKAHLRASKPYDRVTAKTKSELFCELILTRRHQGQAGTRYVVPVEDLTLSGDIIFLGDKRETGKLARDGATVSQDNTVDQITQNTQGWIMFGITSPSYRLMQGS